MTDAASHGQLMDSVYRHQRRIYDATRKHYLLGRDHLIANMNVRAGETVLEVACGTGRNLDLIRRRYPEARLFGLDISEEMLISARAKLRDGVRLARADACNFDPAALYAVPSFDHIVISYSLSMIPDWQLALRHAHQHLAPSGRLHVVDFGEQQGLPLWFRRALRNWLARFHVTVRTDLQSRMAELAGDGQIVADRDLYRGYAIYVRLEPQAGWLLNRYSSS